MKENFLHQKLLVTNYEAILAEMREYDKVLGDFSKFSKLDNAVAMKHLPSVYAWFRANGAEVASSFHINIKAGITQAVHIDTITTNLAVNFPVRGCDEAYTVFYRNKGKIVTEYTPHTNLPFERYVDPELQEIGRYVLDSPVILNVKIPHSVVNLGKQNRVCFSFRFKQDPWHLIQ